MLAAILIAASACIAIGLGCAHLYLTYFTRAFSPRDAQLEARLKSVAPLLTRQMTMWRAQTGFHASHSLGAIVFGAVYANLALAHAQLLFHSPFLLVFGALVLLVYVLLAKLYWFVLPLLGLIAALVLYVAGVMVAYV
ncbi:MAG: LIC_13387 family protein [Solimonas sp.]